MEYMIVYRIIGGYPYNDCTGVNYRIVRPVPLIITKKRIFFTKTRYYLQFSYEYRFLKDISNYIPADSQAGSMTFTPLLSTLPQYSCPWNFLTTLTSVEYDKKITHRKYFWGRVAEYSRIRVSTAQPWKFHINPDITKKYLPS